MNIFITAIRAYAPWVMLPVSGAIGFVGYHMEWWLRKGEDQAKDKDSVSQQRDERKLEQFINEDCTVVESVTHREQKPKDIFDKNVPTKEQRKFI